jgi:hypothetical protein
MSEYKYIHLTNGDHLFTELRFPKAKTGFFKLKNPLKLQMKEDAEHVHFGFMPWIPFSDDEEFPLSAKSIVTIANLNEEYTKIYKKGLNHHAKLEDVIEFDPDNSEIPNILMN